MKTDSALSYFGADGVVARELAAMLDHCSHVTIPFCGGMSILPWLKARAVVANDRNEWLCEDFRAVLAKVKDTPDSGIYLDPPWRGLDDSYIHKFTDQDHVNLYNDLLRFRETTVVLRYGDDEFIRGLYSVPGFTIIEVESRTQSNKMTGELWITNKGTA